MQPRDGLSTRRRAYHQALATLGESLLEAHGSAAKASSQSVGALATGERVVVRFANPRPQDETISHSTQRPPSAHTVRVSVRGSRRLRFAARQRSGRRTQDGHICRLQRDHGDPAADVASPCTTAALRSAIQARLAPASEKHSSPRSSPQSELFETTQPASVHQKTCPTPLRSRTRTHAQTIVPTTSVSANFMRPPCRPQRSLCQQLKKNFRRT